MYRLLAIAALLFLAQGALARDYNWPLWVTTQAEIDALPADADAVAFQPDDESAKYDFSRLKDLRTVHTCRTGIRWFASATGVTKLVILDDDIDDELSALTTAGAHPVRLGPTVLRTSTAAAVALGALGVLTPRWA